VPSGARDRHDPWVLGRQPCRPFSIRLTAYTAEPGSRSHDALRLLASWAATSRHESATESGPVSRAQP
jgi:hypothetical protein